MKRGYNIQKEGKREERTKPLGGGGAAEGRECTWKHKCERKRRKKCSKETRERKREINVFFK